MNRRLEQIETRHTHQPDQSHQQGVFDEILASFVAYKVREEGHHHLK